MIFYKGFAIIEHSEENEDEDDSDFKIIAFSENKSELQPVLKSLEEKQKQKSLLSQEADNFVRLYENDWKKDICPRSKEDHERIRLSKFSSEARQEYDKVVSEKKKIFTKSWIEKNPIPKNIARLIAIDGNSINRTCFFEIWYEIKKVS
jgi:hypothetical protein